MCFRERLSSILGSAYSGFVPSCLDRRLRRNEGFGADSFIGQALEYDVANVVDPNFTVVARIRKTFIPR